jgi:hypothetical protein
MVAMLLRVGLLMEHHPKGQVTQQCRHHRVTQGLRVTLNLRVTQELRVTLVTAVVAQQLAQVLHHLLHLQTRLTHR